MLAENETLDDVEAYLAEHERKSLLRFITCGSVDDGKSTLIGRLLYESKMIFDDQLDALEADSKRQGSADGEIDFSLLVDGLAAEREQGITIDVAYRFFSTAARKFVVADTPGHEQYTRNMATGASTADLAVILLDARKGVLVQTRRHSYITRLLGVRHVVVAVNKMDLVDYSEARFREIEAEYAAFAAEIGFDPALITAIPLSALKGDNVTERSARTAWWNGPTLLEHLGAVEVDAAAHAAPFRMPVQWVNRPSPEFRGFAGTIAGGVVRVGDAVRTLPSARVSQVERIVTYDGDLQEAVAGQSVTLTLADEIDSSRGDVFCAAAAPAGVSDQFEARVLWMAEDAMLPGRSYLMKIGSATVNARLERPKYKIDVNTLDHLAARTLGLNEIGVCNIALDRAVAFDPYEENRETGGFILIDRMTNGTVGMGLIRFALRRASNIHLQHLDIDAGARAAAKGQKGSAVWLTGLSGAGKSTIANLVEKKLYAEGRHTYVLDGDNVRHGLNKDLGFTDADRVENIRRVSEVAKLMVDAGLLVLVAFISPFRSERDGARALFEDGQFFEVHVDTPLGVAESRDVKGLYKKAREGLIANFTGVSSPYEPPLAPELVVDTATMSPEEAADAVIEALRSAGRLDA